MRQLSESEQAFVVNKAKGMSNRDAAIAARLAPGEGDRLMSDPVIRNELKAHEL